jgi:acetyl esterase/lipase
MASNNTGSSGEGSADELLHEFGIVRVYKSGRVERPLAAPPVAPGLDTATAVESRDVQLGQYSVRLYLPPAAATTVSGGAKLPIIVYVHGGGFVAESAASPGGHRFLNRLTAACPAVSVSVEYRLAPEHPLPAAYDDSLAALKWTLSATDPWIAMHGDLDRVFVAGDSAGANICHYLAVHPDVADARHAGQGPRRRLKGAVLIHPWFWGSEAVGGEPGNPAARAMGARLWLFACPDADGMDDPRMNPMAPGAPGLDTLACDRVLVCTAEHDFLRWRGRAYAEAVATARGAEGEGSVELLETEGEGHVFFVYKPDGDKAKDMLDRIVAFVNAP